MAVNPDFKDLLKAFNDYNVEYLVVGAYAVMYYTEPRFTKDIDIWIYPSEENANRVWQALAEFGVPLEQVSLSDFTNKELVYQVGVAPNRIDVMMDVPGVEFSVAWKKRVLSTYAGEQINIIGLAELIATKKQAGREQDLLDLKRLNEVITTGKN